MEETVKTVVEWHLTHTGWLATPIEYESDPTPAPPPDRVLTYRYTQTHDLDNSVITREISLIWQTSNAAEYRLVTKRYGEFPRPHARPALSSVH